jgi:hypothetical protein
MGLKYYPSLLAVVKAERGQAVPFAKTRFPLPISKGITRSPWRGNPRLRNATHPMMPSMILSYRPDPMLARASVPLPGEYHGGDRLAIDTPPGYLLPPHTEQAVNPLACASDRLIGLAVLK